MKKRKCQYDTLHSWPVLSWSGLLGGWLKGGVVGRHLNCVSCYQSGLKRHRQQKGINQLSTPRRWRMGQCQKALRCLETPVSRSDSSRPGLCMKDNAKMPTPTSKTNASCGFRNRWDYYDFHNKLWQIRRAGIIRHH